MECLFWDLMGELDCPYLIGGFDCDNIDDCPMNEDAWCRVKIKNMVNIEQVLRRTKNAQNSSK